MLTVAIKQFTLWLATGTEAIAGALIAIAVIEATIRTVPIALRSFRAANPAWSHEAKEEVRLRLGRWLALALEFELGADILRTAIAPTWSEIGQLAAIAAVRTALNYFLQQEIDKAAVRRGGSSQPDSGPSSFSIAPPPEVGAPNGDVQRQA